jgi:hypothetical protein
MEMISHHDPGMHPPTVILADLLQSIQERLVILLPDEDLLASISTGHHMIYRTRVLESHLPCHGRKLSHPTHPSQYRKL